MRAQAGIPRELTGLGNINADDEILRLDNMLQQSIEPRIPGIVIRPVSLEPEGVALVMSIPRSWAAPHVVKLEGHWRFYSRNSAGKYPLDVAEVRAAFVLSETLAERIKNFRIDRLGKIVATETPVSVAEGAKSVFHIVPFNAFEPGMVFDLTTLLEQFGPPRTISSGGGWNYRHNFDGIVTYAGSPQAASYVQVFRNGIIEAVDAALLHPHPGSKPLIRINDYETYLIRALKEYLLVANRLGVVPPFTLSLSLLGVSGYAIEVGNSHTSASDFNAIERDTLLIPEVLVEDVEVEPENVLKPIFDAIWNACGFSRSLNYNDDGKRVKR